MPRTKEEIALYQAEYRAKNRERLAAGRRSWYERNKAACLSKAKAYREANRDKIIAGHRQRYQENRETYRANMRKWVIENPDARNKYKAAYEARKLKATPAWANDFFVEEAYALAKLREKICGGEWQVDHIVPLRSKVVCGLHTHDNLQVIQRAHNASKGNRHWPEMP